MIGIRNFLIHEYDKIDDAFIYGVLKKHLEDLENVMNALLKARKKE